MKVSDSGPDKSIQELTIGNCVFENLYYDIGSLVRLPDKDSGSSWSLAITDSEFKNLDFCGSIVSNDVTYFEGNLGKSIEEQ